MESRNDDAHWAAFDPTWYFELNYRHLRDDDRNIIELTRDFFGQHATGLPKDAAGVDLGSGTNLYPALTMLPFCASINLQEPTEANILWLKRSLAQESEQTWAAFWDVLHTHSAYSSVDDHWSALRERTVITKTGIWEPRDPQWHIGTMFFVAESISADIPEFQASMSNFINGLLPGAPFAIGLMAGSEGHPVNSTSIVFPTVSISAQDVQEVLTPITSVLNLHRIPTPGAGPLRSGYDCMLLALGLV